jgi:hypothetical protein
MLDYLMWLAQRSPVLHALKGIVRDVVDWVVCDRPVLPDLKREAWYWSPKWQQAEAEADKDVAEGRYADVRTVPALQALLTREQPDVLFEALRAHRP